MPLIKEHDKCNKTNLVYAKMATLDPEINLLTLHEELNQTANTTQVKRRNKNDSFQHGVNHKNQAILGLENRQNRDFLSIHIQLIVIWTR